MQHLDLVFQDFLIMEFNMLGIHVCTNTILHFIMNLKSLYDDVTKTTKYFSAFSNMSTLCWKDINLRTVIKKDR